jgi:hypothetical protein
MNASEHLDRDKDADIRQCVWQFRVQTVKAHISSSSRRQSSRTPIKHKSSLRLPVRSGRPVVLGKLMRPSAMKAAPATNGCSCTTRRPDHHRDGHNGGENGPNACRQALGVSHNVVVESRACEIPDVSGAYDPIQGWAKDPGWATSDAERVAEAMLANVTLWSESRRQHFCANTRCSRVLHL